MRVLVRVATERDDALIEALAQDAGLNVRPGDERKETQARRGVADILQLPEPKFAGFVLCRGGADGGEVLDVAVVREHRCQGVGAALMRHGLEMAVGEGCTTAFLEVRRKNAPALALYRAC